MSEKISADMIKTDVERQLGRETSFWFGFNKNKEMAFSKDENDFNNNLLKANLFESISDENYYDTIVQIANRIDKQEGKPFKSSTMKYYLGIDPGKQGAFVVIDENSNVVEKIGTPLIGKEYDRQGIVSILTKYPYHKIGLENPDVMFGVGKSVVASLSHCVGLIEGMMLGLKVPFILIKPKEWQKECWKHVKTQKKVDGTGNDTKATSTMAAVNLWPSENFKVTNIGNPSKNHNDGMVDAVLVAEYVRRMFK